MNERDIRLRQFFSSYFNQDWDVGGATSWPDVVAEYVKENSNVQVAALRRDLESWFQETTPESLGGLPAMFGCAYDPHPDGVNEREWIVMLIDSLGKQLTS